MRSILPPAHTFRGLLCLGASLLALVAVTNALAAHSSSLAGGAFGQTQAGSSLDTGGAGYLDVSGPYTVAGPVSVGKLSAYVAGGASVSKFRGVIYADNGGQPGALVGVTPEVTIAAGRAAGWVDLTFTTPVSIGAGSFWLGYWYADSNSRHYFVGQSGAERFVRAAYSSSSSPPAAFGAAATSSSSYSLYATYTTSAGGAPVNTALPSISGTAQQGQTLTASNGSWTNGPTSFGYRWQDCDSGGASCAPIGGATQPSYVLAAGDFGKAIRVVVTATNTAGSADATSAATAVVSAAGGGGPYAFVRHSIPPGAYAQVTEGNNIGDIDGDGKPDVVVGGDSYLVWYHSPDWAPHLIFNGKNAGGSMVLVVDVNGDGRNDVLTGEQSSAICGGTCQTDWFEHTAGDTWVKHVLVTGVYCHDLSSADLNGDGRLDLACDDLAHSKVFWLEHPLDPTQPWPAHQVDTGDTMGTQVADIDGDGVPDIVAGRVWYDNVNGDGSSWVRHPYTTLSGPEFVTTVNFSNRAKIVVLDLNGDGRLDIVSTLFTEGPSSQVWAFLAPADPITQSWTPLELDAGPLFAVHSEVAADFDGSGRPQIAVGESDPGGWNFGSNPDMKLSIYRLVGSPASDPSSWEKTTVDTIESHEMRVGDLNGDGRPDLVGNTENSDLLTPPQNGQVHWWENTFGAAAQPPTNSTPPSVYGTPLQGNTLTSSNDFWTGTGPITVAYQWQDCASGGSSCSPIAGAVGATYLLGASDVGHTIRLVVTATNGAGSGTITSAATGLVASSSAVPVASAAPSVSGIAQKGSLQSALNGSWTGSPSSFAYQWTRCDGSGNACTVILGATRANYLAGAVDLGKTLRVRVTATNGNGATLAVSAPTAPIADSSAGILGRSVLGPLQNGGRKDVLDASGPYALAASATVSTLSAYVGDPTGPIALRGAIYADDGSGKPGALVGVSSEQTVGTNATAAWVNFSFPAPLSLPAGQYWLALWFSSDDGHVYYDRVAGADRFTAAPYSSTGAPNGAFGASSADERSYSLYATYLPGSSPPVNTGAPSISGLAQQGETLTAANGTWTGNPIGFTYQWQDCDGSGGSCANIPSATGKTYPLQASDVGHTVRVIVVATSAGGSAAAPSAVTATVSSLPGAGTFGQTQAGSSVDTGGAGYLDVSGPYSVAAPVSVGKLSAYVAGGAAVSRFRGVIYADNGGQPGALVGVTPEVTVAAGQAAGWVDLTFTTPVSIVAGSFWLGYWYADSSSRHYFVVQAGAERYVRAAYSSSASPPAAFGAASSSTGSYSFYATYSAP